MVSVGEITVELNLDSGKLTSGLRNATSQLDAFGRKVEGIEGKFSGLANSSVFSKIGNAFSSIGTAALVGGIAAVGVAVTGVTATVGKSLTMFNSYEQAIANTASVFGLVGEAFEKEKAAIDAIAQKLGADTVFSSEEAAQAMYNLASAGYDVAAMGYEGLLPFLNLASATQSDLAFTTEFMAATLSIFGLEMSETGRVADVMARAIADSQATMEKLNYSMAYVGPTAAMLNMDLEETTALLEVLYNGGLKGEKAGTGLRGVLVSLLNPTKNAQEAFAELGITAEDVNPLTHEMSEILEVFADAEINAAQAAKIFGRTASPAFQILLAGAADAKKFEESLRAAGGAAQIMAEQQLDTLHGSLEQLEGDIQNMFINIGAELSPTVRDILGGLESLMPGISEFAVNAAKQFAHFVDTLKSSGESIVAIGSIISESMAYVFRQIGGMNAGDGLADFINDMMKRVVDLVIAAKPVIEKAVIGIVNFIKSVFAGLGPTFENLKTIAGNIVRVVVALFAGISGAAGGGASSAITNTINGISGVFADLSTSIADRLIEVIPKLIEIFGKIYDTVIDWGNNFGNIKSTLGVKLRGIWEAIEEVGERLEPAWKAVTDAFDVGATALEWNVGSTSSIGETLKGIWNNLPQILMDAVDALQPVWDFLNVSFTFASKVFQGFITNISPTFDNLKSSFESIIGILGDLGKDIGKALAGMFSSMSEDGGAEKLGASIAKTINAITGAIADLLKWLDENPKVVEFGLALVGVAVAAAALVSGLASLVLFVAPLVSTIGTLIVIVKTFGISWSSVGQIIGYLAGKIFPNFTRNLLLIYKNVAPVARIVGSGLSKAFSKLVPTLLRLGSRVLPLLSRAFGLVGRVMLIVARSGIMTIIRLLPMLASPIGIIITLIGLLVVAWVKDWGGIREKTYAVVNFLKDQFNKLKKEMELIGPALTGAKEKLNQSWEDLKQIFSDAIQSIKATLKGWKDGFKQDMDEAGEELTAFKDGVKEKWDAIKQSFSDAVDGIVETVSGWKDSIKEKLDGAAQALDDLKTSAKQKWDEIKQSFKDAIDDISEVVGGLKNSLEQKISEIKAGVLAKLTEISKTFEDWRDTLDLIFARVGELVGVLKSVLEAKWDEIKATIVRKLDEIKLKLNTWYSELEGIYKQVQTSLENLKTQVTAKWDALKAAIIQKTNEIKAQLTAWYNNLVSLYNQVMASLENLKNQLIAKWDAIKAAIIQKINEIKAQLISWLAQLKGVFNQIVNAVLDLKNRVVQKFTEMKTQVTQKLNDIKSVISQKASEVKSLASSWYNAAVEIGNKIVEGLKSKLGAVKDAAKSLYDAMSSGAKSTGKAISDGISSGTKKVVSLSEAATRTASSFFPHSPAKKGAFRKLPNWLAVLPGNMGEGVSKMKDYVAEAMRIAVQLKNPIGIMSRTGVDLNTNALSGINNISFDKFEYSIISLINRMIELIDTSDRLSASLASNEGYSLDNTTGTYTSSRYGGSLSTGSLTNVKISTIYNNGSSLSTAKLKKAGI